MAHIYTLDNEEYPSVTTIIKLISGSASLMKWSNYLGFMRKDYNEVLNSYAEYGTKVHLFMQTFLESLNTPTINEFKFKDNLEKYEFKNILKNFNNAFNNTNYKVLATEKTLISKKLKYGGTLDALLDIDDKKVLIDFKTSKTLRPTMYLQLGGYDNLLQEIEHIKVDYAMIVLISELKCQKYLLDRDKLSNYAIAFNLLYNFYQEWNKLK